MIQSRLKQQEKLLRHAKHQGHSRYQIIMVILIAVLEMVSKF